MKNRELVIFPLIIAILGLFLYVIGDTLSGEFVKIFFPQTSTIFEFLKIYFTSFLLIYICGLFTDDCKINNYLFSRVVGSIMMMAITVLLGSLAHLVFKEVKPYMLLIIFFISIWGGQLVSYFVQNYNLKYQNTMAIILQTFITLFIAYFTIYPLNNYLF